MQRRGKGALSKPRVAASQDPLVPVPEKVALDWEMAIPVRTVFWAEAPAAEVAAPAPRDLENWVRQRAS
jgi:hypothetical protein